MRKAKANSNLYTHLRKSGVLEHGNHEQIQSARKEYWKEYKRLWKKDRRKKEKEFTISFNSEEQKILTEAAKRHKISRTAFIKQATFAYINNSFVVPDSMEVKQIAQLLAMSYNSIQELFVEDKIDSQIGRVLFEKISDLEREILPLLHSPKSLEEYIKDHIQKNNKNKPHLVEFINTI
jgi:predicted HicB family RNase H-like nuclease